jgi:hypothetical protein
MGTALFFKPASKDGRRLYPFAGSTSAEMHWWPVIRNSNLRLLEEAFDPGLTLDERCYPRIIEELTTVLAKFKEMPSSTQGIEGAIERCSELLRLIKSYPPGSGVELHIG